MNGAGRRATHTHRYRAYGLTIEIPLACSDLAPADAEADADIVVEENAVSAGLRSPAHREPGCDVASGSFLSRGGPRGGRFLVRGADRVVLERHPEADDAILAAQFVSTVLPVILHHRGLLVLHANGAVADGRAVLVAGPSGAGKSTTLAALLARGCRMLSDDVSALRVGRDGRIEVVPGPARIRLTSASASAVGVDIGAPAAGGVKSVVRSEPSMASEAVPLGGIYVLASERREGVDCTALAGVAKLEALLGCLYGPVLRSEHEALFPLLRGVLERVAVFALRRPDDRWSVGELVDRIVETTPASARRSPSSDRR